MRRILIVLLLATSLFAQTNVGVLKIDTERTLLKKATDVAPQVVQRQTYYLSDDGRQRHENTQVPTGKTTVEITLSAEHKQIVLDLQSKQATIRSAVTPPPSPTGRTGRIGRMIAPQSQTDLGTKIVYGLTLHGGLFIFPSAGGSVRQENWDYRGAVQSPNVLPVIVESRWDDPISTEEERIVGVSNVQVLASMFEVPADFVVNGRDPASTARLLDQLAAAEAKWMVNKPKVYEFRIEQMCFCGPIPPGWDPIIFRVEDAMPSLVSGERAFAFRKYLENYNTVEKLFNYVRAELAKHDYRVEVDYDPDFGYPKRIFTDPAQNTFDDEMTLMIEGFRVAVK
jgi:hypothetical protein